MQERLGSSERYAGAFVIDASPAEILEGNFKSDITKDWETFLKKMGDDHKVDLFRVTRAISNIIREGLDVFADAKYEEITAELSGRWLMTEEGRRSDARTPRVYLVNRGRFWQVLKVENDLRRFRTSCVCHTLCKTTSGQEYTYLPEDVLTA